MPDPAIDPSLFAHLLQKAQTIGPDTYGSTGMGAETMAMVPPLGDLAKGAGALLGKGKTFWEAATDVLTRGFGAGKATDEAVQAARDVLARAPKSLNPLEQNVANTLKLRVQMADRAAAATPEAAITPAAPLTTSAPPQSFFARANNLLTGFNPSGWSDPTKLQAARDLLTATPQQMNPTERQLVRVLQGRVDLADRSAGMPKPVGITSPIQPMTPTAPAGSPTPDVGNVSIDQLLNGMNLNWAQDQVLANDAATPMEYRNLMAELIKRIKR